MLQTARLMIRNWTVADVPVYAKIVSDAAVMRYLGNGKPLSADEAESYVLANMARYNQLGWSRFPVCLTGSDALIGFCGFSIINNEIDLGWRYGQSYWHKGYATEAAQAVLHLGLDVLRFPRIVCLSDVANKASIRVIEKIGMNFEKEILMTNGRQARQYAKTAKQSDERC